MSISDRIRVLRWLAAGGPGNAMYAYELAELLDQLKPKKKRRGRDD